MNRDASLFKSALAFSRLPRSFLPPPPHPTPSRHPFRDSVECYSRFELIPRARFFSSLLSFAERESVSERNRSIRAGIAPDLRQTRRQRNVTRCLYKRIIDIRV